MKILVDYDEVTGKIVLPDGIEWFIGAQYAYLKHDESSSEPIAPNQPSTADEILKLKSTFSTNEIFKMKEKGLI